MKGLINWFANNPVAANLMMIAIIFGGLMSMTTLNREIMPSMPSKFIEVSVVYLGADPIEVEDRISIRVEEAIREIEGVININSVSMQGRGIITAEVSAGYDLQKVLNEIKVQVDAINTFPKEGERPSIRLIKFRERVIQVAVMADTDEKSLKIIAQKVRDDLAALPGVDFAEMKGDRNYEVGIEVSEVALRRYGLTFDAVVEAVRQSSLNMPAGTIKAIAGDMTLRTKSQAYNTSDFKNITLLKKRDGTRVLLGDVAEVVDGFEEDQVLARFNNKPAIFINVLLTTAPDVVAVTKEVRDYIAKSGSFLPDGVTLVSWLDLSNTFKGRVNILLSSGVNGLILVFSLLMLFLRPAIAFWVCGGIITSFMGALWILPMLDVSLNMLTLFAFILVLGIVVDDAIIIGESVHSDQERGLRGLEAATSGANNVSKPVMFAALTTMVAFSPILFLDGVAAAVMKPLPIVVILALTFSLIEAFFILPSHLAHMKPPGEAKGFITRFLRKIRQAVSGQLSIFVQKYYVPFLAKTLKKKYLTLSAFVAIWLILFSFVQGGWMRQDFFPTIPSDYIIADVVLTDGIAFDRAESVMRQVEKAAHTLSRAEFKNEDGEPEANPIKNIQTFVKGNKVQVFVDLLPAEERSVDIVEISRRWRHLIGDMADVKQFDMRFQLRAQNKPLSFVLASNNRRTLEKATADLTTALSKFSGVLDIGDTLRSARQEMVLDLKKEAESLGVSTRDLARQVRQGFFGEEAQRIPRGKDDVKVMIRYPLESRKTVETLKTMRIRTNNGTEVPFEVVADIHFEQGATEIRRLNRRRVVEITGDVDTEITNAQEVIRKVEREVIPTLQKKYPDLEYLLEGDQKEIKSFQAGLLRNTAMAFLAIYALIAVAFRSYSQPILVMLAIPFGYLGSVLGHMFLDLPFSMFSFLGVVATAGVVVNDNLVLIDYINRLRANGESAIDAVRKAAESRFRPIFLTTLTTFIGLMPIISEQSKQAQFLIPMAISLAFGVVLSSFVTLILVPNLFVVLDSFKTWVKGKIFRIRQNRQSQNL
ncbi:MAG: efflux RND transporter permease subunit [Emcibacter sp.]|nr:efflux RND transporter permease subunit [Emcibacter sp.]